MADTRSFIADIITEINAATDPESVTNIMVARVMQYFMDQSEATVVHHTETTASITPRDLHAWGGVQSLEVSFVNGTPGCENEYKLEFTVSGDNFTISLPAGVRWIEEPEWQDGWTYQVSILNNLAIYAGWEAAQS